MNVLYKDVIGIIAEYLEPETSAYAPTLNKEVGVILEIAELAKAADISIPRVFDRALRNQARDGRRLYSKLAMQIGTLATCAGLGRFKDVKNILEKPAVIHFDLRDAISPFSLPRFIAFSKAAESAIINDQPQMLKYLLNHYRFKEMVNTKMSYSPLTWHDRQDMNRPKAKKTIERNGIISHKKAARNEILSSTAKKCAELGRVDCLKVLCEFDGNNDVFQRNFGPLLDLAKKGNHLECAKLIIRNLDTSDRD